MARVTRISQATPDRVDVRRRDLTGDLMGRLSFTEYAHLLLTGREPTNDERFFFDVLLVSLAVHAQAERSAGRLHTPGRRSRREASRARSSSSRSRASSLDTAGRWRRWSSAALNGSARRAHRRTDARSDPREHCERARTGHA